MPRFATTRGRSARQHPITEFYREEFLKHHRCLQRQRPYYSESAITDVEAALDKNHEPARTAFRPRRRRPARQLTPQEIRRRNRAFGLVGPQAHPLTRSHPDLRQDVLAIVRAGIRAVDAEALTHVRWTPARLARVQATRAPHVPISASVVAAGKAAPARWQGRAGDGTCGIRARDWSGRARRRVDAAAPRPLRVNRRRPSGARQPPASGPGVRRWRSPNRSAPGETLLVLLSGGASALMAVPADGITLDDKRRRHGSVCCGPAPTFTRSTPSASTCRPSRAAGSPRAPAARAARSSSPTSSATTPASSRRDRRSPTQHVSRRARRARAIRRRTRRIRAAVVEHLSRGDRRNAEARRPRPCAQRRRPSSDRARDAMAGAAIRGRARGYHVRSHRRTR